MWLLLFAALAANTPEMRDEWRLACARADLVAHCKAMDPQTYLRERLRLAGRWEKEEVIRTSEQRMKRFEDRRKESDRKLKEVIEKARQKGLLPPPPPDLK